MPAEIFIRRPQQVLSSRNFHERIHERPSMMAFEQTPGSPHLEAKTIEALRSALARSVTQGNHAAELRDLLCQTAAEARDKGIRAEHLLIALKDIWFSLPELATKTPTDVDHTLLQELISRCIQEYYAV
jgi:hypothetical protein